MILNLKASIDRKFEARLGQEEMSEDEKRKKQEQNEIEEAQVNEELSIDSIKNVLRVVGMPIYNLSLVETSD